MNHAGDAAINVHREGGTLAASNAAKRGPNAFGKFASAGGRYASAALRWMTSGFMGPFGLAVGIGGFLFEMIARQYEENNPGRRTYTAQERQAWIDKYGFDPVMSGRYIGSEEEYLAELQDEKEARAEWELKNPASEWEKALNQGGDALELYKAKVKILEKVLEQMGKINYYKNLHFNQRLQMLRNLQFEIDQIRRRKQIIAYRQSALAQKGLVLPTTGRTRGREPGYAGSLPKPKYKSRAKIIKEVDVRGRKLVTFIDPDDGKTKTMERDAFNSKYMVPVASGKKMTIARRQFVTPYEARPKKKNQRKYKTTPLKV